MRQMETEVCIVGAGAAGGILAWELARRGARVVILESGPRHDFRQRGEYVRRYLKHENPWRTPQQELDRHTVGGATPYHLEWRRARGVGGSTLHWEGYALRLHADDFRLRSLYGIADDWPISYQDRSEEHTSELQSQSNLVCRLLLEKKKKIYINNQAVLKTLMSTPQTH